jgi:sigma-B regulation protein RsbU (phosphoserine phosphatase)
MRRHINHVNQKTLVQSVNREFVSVGDASTFATGVVATFFVPTGTFTLSNAGHPSPLWFDSRRQEWCPLESRHSSTAPTDVPLGMFEQAEYGRIDLKLSTEDFVLCFTDGLEECVDEHGEVLGRDGVRRLVSGTDHRRPDRIISGILDRVASMSPENLSHDDVTIVLIRPNGAKVPLSDTVLAPFRYLSDLVGLRR